MATFVPHSGGTRQPGFRQVVDAFLGGDGLPFAEILSAERIERVFARHNCRFGLQGIYTTAIMVWSFLSQVLRDGKEASCQAAVARIVSYCELSGRVAPTEDTGDYCRARAKLSEAALHDLSCEVAQELEQAADPSWLWRGEHHAKLIDGFTFTMPDTPKNQAQYPQHPGQQPGIGLPIARAVAILSLATACVLDLAIGPYQGKETGESALLRSMLDQLALGDVAVFDRYYCSFMLIALLQQRGVHVCARRHQRRHADFRRGTQLDRHDHLIVWTRPARPAWMDEETYASIPETLELREIRYHIVERGRRTRTIDIITTYLDPDQYSKQDLAELYGFRWNSELDIRSIKASLNLVHVRCKSPEMVRRELWTTMLAYNLIRTTAAGAAWLHDKQPRQISFTSTCQYVLASWMQLSTGRMDSARWEHYLRRILQQIAACLVANRPGRLEPRVLKRRRHGYPLMRKSRSELRKELRRTCT
jgi:hypothetical protein